MVLLPAGPAGLHPHTGRLSSVQPHHGFAHLMLLCRRQLLSARTGRVSIDTSSCQSRTRLLLEMFPLRGAPFSRTFSRGGGEGMGERGRKRRGGGRAVRAADGEVSDRRS